MDLSDNKINSNKLRAEVGFVFQQFDPFIKRGTAFIRPVFITMVPALVGRLIYLNFK
jgi:ABC-type polar amino acid transport system ATPase subunit